MNANSTAIMPGGSLRVSYHLNTMWSLGIGTALGYGGVNNTAFLTPAATVSWTPDINKPTAPFALLGVGLLYEKSPPAVVGTSNFGVELGVGVRHMIGDALALRIEGGMMVGQAGNTQTTGIGHATVGLSYFVGAKKVLTGIGVNPAVATLTTLRQTEQLTAAGRDQNGKPMAIPAVQWRSSNPSVVSVSPTGTVTAMGDGSATITASSGTVSGTSTVTVARTAGTVAVAPATASLNALGANQQVTAAVKDAGNNPIATAPVTWSSSDPGVATVSPSGLVTAVNNGTARITATSGGKTATTTVTVAQTTASVVVTPATASVNQRGGTAQYSAQALDPNGRPITGKTFSWTSDAPAVATISATGAATAVANGVAHITASADGKSGSAIATVVIAARPVELPEAVGASMVMRAVTFRVNRAILTPGARTELDKVAITMQGMPNARWEIAGYTSSLGARARNMTLSRQRAEAVRTYLIGKGVAAANLTAVGYGPANPIASNRTARGRAQNMRVEIKRLQ